jgi:hypothetical protein
MENNELNKYDTVLILAKPVISSNHTDVSDIIFKGILIDWLHSKDFEYPKKHVTLILNSDNVLVKDFKLSHKQMQANSISNDCKILPARIVLTEKTIDWEPRNL